MEKGLFTDNMHKYTKTPITICSKYSERQKLMTDAVENELTNNISKNSKEFDNWSQTVVPGL